MADSDSDPGEDTMKEDQYRQVIPAKQVQYLIRQGLLASKKVVVVVQLSPEDKVEV